MSPVKRFLLVFFVVYMAGGMVWIFLFGPPGLSSGYLEQYKGDHEQYLEITKSDWYKLYLQRPKLHPPANVRQERQVAFVDEYAHRPAFVEESKRTALFRNFFEFYNAIAVVIIAVRFGRKPFLAFVDQQVSDLRAKMEKARAAREAASIRRGKAQAIIDSLEADKARLDGQTREVVAENARAIEEGKEHILAQIDEETENRKRLEEHHAAMRLKKELVDRAIAELTDQLKASPSPQWQAAMIERFMRGLEKTG